MTDAPNADGVDPWKRWLDVVELVAKLRQQPLLEVRVVESSPDLCYYPAVYILYDGDRLVYVGQTSQLSQRLASHRRRKKISHVRFVGIDDSALRLAVEAALIASLWPPQNRGVFLRVCRAGVSEIRWRNRDAHL